MKKVAFLFIVNNFEREHLGVMQIASCLLKNNMPVHVLEAQLSKIKPLLGHLCSEYQHTIIGYSTPTVFAPFYINLNRVLKKEFPFISLFGGPHPTFFPDMIEEDGVDIICRGEGEYAALEIAERLSSDSRIDDIENLWVKENGRIHKNRLRPSIRDLDSLPFPDRAIFRRDLKKTNTSNMIMLTSRGCPFSCSYCFNQSFANLYRDAAKIIRRRSVQNVIEEIMTARVKHDIQFISFVDSIFTLDRAWLADFSNTYKKTVRLPFYCNVHPDFINNESAAVLADCGCSAIGMGVECGEEKIRNTVLNRKTSDERIREAASIIRRHNIKLATGNILGIPGGSIKDDLKTLRLNIKCRADYAMTYMMSLYPGTEIYRAAEKNGYISKTPSVHYNGVNWSYTKKFRSRLEERMTLNLQNLFGTTVKFPLLYPFIIFLIRLPFGRFYFLIHIIYEAVSTSTYKKHRKQLIGRTLKHLSLISTRLKYYANSHAVGDRNPPPVTDVEKYH